MTRDIKYEFSAYVRETLNLPAPGISPVHDFQDRELQGMRALTEYIKTVAGAPPELQRLAHPRAMLSGLNSIIIVAIPNHMTGPRTFEQSRSQLRGAMSAGHLSAALQKRMARVQEAITTFFTDRGHACRPLPPNAPLKIFAARSGIGFYGKNSMVITRQHGSWVSLSGYAADAQLEPDHPIEDDCGNCTLCLQACPAKALDHPYACTIEDCINFQLQSKNVIPEAARPLFKHGLAYGACRICRDVCPHNQNLVPLADPALKPETLNPSLLEFLDLDEDQWDREFAATRMGAIMQHRRFIIRNALIALANFKDSRTLGRIAEKLDSGDALVREYAAWALGSIGGAKARTFLQEALGREACEPVRCAIHAALKKQSAIGAIKG